ncbi:tail tape measure protein [Sphingomonas suaedae]|uniref:Tail tape measure protein n=1 Tax=Sphingomonas suaedae TaxID=2599297 RepID=A0A518RIY3_9SPHN|nr:tail tape measure protein [Sphingomonas suaedae]QDX27379.1 tail tape measure protein [Sphingomonas suaedae]
MDEEIERLVVSVRADTQGFARDVAEMRGAIDGPLQAGADRAGRGIETALLRAVRTGKLGFEDLKRMANQMLAEIAADAVRGGLGAIFGSGGLGGLIGGLFGLPGRATGGPVAPGRPYVVGERGPELFVPTASGRVEVPMPGGGRDVRVAITIHAPGGGEAAGALRQSSRQVARAVKAALSGVD